MRKPLYQIESDYLAIADALEQGELTPEIETALAITEHELQVKAVGYGFIIKDAEDTINAIDARIKELTERKKSEQRKVDKMKAAISQAMQLFGIHEVKTHTLKLSFRKSSRVVGMSFDELPEAFLTIVPEKRTPNLTAIGNALKEGQAVGDYRIEEHLNLQIK